MPTKVHIVKAMVFLVVVYGCERWTINKAECQRTDAFELWCWRRLLRVPWTARRSNQSILKKIKRDYIKKQRHYFTNKGPCSQNYGFSSGHVWMWELDYKKTQCWRIEAFELWCWRRLLRVPWTARRFNQSILKEIIPEYLSEGLMLKLKLQYFATWCKELTYLKIPWCWERLKAGEKGNHRGWDGWMASPTEWTWVWVKSGS